MNKRVMVSLICVLSLLLVASAMADNPVAKGKILLDGATNGSFMTKSGDLNKVGDKSPSYFQLNPALAYFLADGIAVGGTVQFAYSKLGDVKTTDIGAGPIVFWFPTAKNADNPKGKVLPFLAGSFVYMQDKTTYPNTSAKLVSVAADNETKNTGWAARFMGGGTWMLNNSLGLHGEAFFELENGKAEVTTAGTTFKGDSNSGTAFGVMIGVLGFFGSGGGGM